MQRLTSSYIIPSFILFLIKGVSFVSGNHGCWMRMSSNSTCFTQQPNASLEAFSSSECANLCHHHKFFIFKPTLSRCQCSYSTCDQGESLESEVWQNTCQLSASTFVAASYALSHIFLLLAVSARAGWMHWKKSRHPEPEFSRTCKTLRTNFFDASELESMALDLQSVQSPKLPRMGNMETPRRRNCSATDNTQQSLLKSCCLFGFLVNSWKLRLVYSSGILHICDVATDAAVLSSWYFQSSIYGSSGNVNNFTFFLVGCGILGGYRVISAINVYLTSDQESTVKRVRDAFLQLFDLLMLKHAFVSHQFGVPMESMIWLHKFEGLLESAPQFILQTVYVIVSPNTEFNHVVVFSSFLSIICLAFRLTWDDEHMFVKRAQNFRPWSIWYYTRMCMRITELASRLSVLALVWVILGGWYLTLISVVELCALTLFYANGHLGWEPWNILAFFFVVADLGLKDVPKKVQRPVNIDTVESRRTSTNARVQRDLEETTQTWLVCLEKLFSVLMCVGVGRQLSDHHQTPPRYLASMYFYARRVHTLCLLATILGLLFFMPFPAWISKRELILSRGWHQLLFCAGTSVLSPLLFYMLMSYKIIEISRSAQHVRSPFDAARYGRPSLLRRIVDRNCECIYETDDTGRTLFQACAETGHKDNMAMLFSRYLHSIDINHQDVNGYTAAHIAAEEGHDDVLEFLGNIGADFSVKTFKGYTPADLIVLNKLTESKVEATLATVRSELCSPPENDVCQERDLFGIVDKALSMKLALPKKHTKPTEVIFKYDKLHDGTRVLRIP